MNCPIILFFYSLKVKVGCFFIVSIFLKNVVDMGWCVCECVCLGKADFDGHANVCDLSQVDL